MFSSILSRTLVIVMIFQCKVERTSARYLPLDSDSNINLSKYL